MLLIAATFSGAASAGVPEQPLQSTMHAVMTVTTSAGCRFCAITGSVEARSRADGNPNRNPLPARSALSRHGHGAISRSRLRAAAEPLPLAAGVAMAQP